MIYTLTFNPAIDYVMKTDSIITGTTNRSSREEIFFGGKGINVSVILNELGVKSTALGFVAGFTGTELENRLKAQGIKTDFIRLKNGMTRINVKLKSDCITEINANGPFIDKEDLNSLFQKLNKLTDGDTLILAGSIPSCLPENIYEEILSLNKNKSIRYVVDAEKDLLLNTLKYKPFLIKPNGDELSAIAGKSLTGDEDITKAARQLQNMGALNVLVSLGSKGAILLDQSGKVYKKSAHKIKAVNTVGAGDSMVAGFLAGIDKGCEYALSLGSAAGAATAMTDGLAAKSDIEKLINKEV